MAVIPYPKIMYGPGGQYRQVLSKEQEGRLGSDWSENPHKAAPTAEFPKYVYNGSDKKLVNSKAEIPDGWADSIKDAEDAEKAAKAAAAAARLAKVSTPTTPKPSDKP